MCLPTLPYLSAWPPHVIQACVPHFEALWLAAQAGDPAAQQAAMRDLVHAFHRASAPLLRNPRLIAAMLTAASPHLQVGLAVARSASRRILLRVAAGFAGLQFKKEIAVALVVALVVAAIVAVGSEYQKRMQQLHPAGPAALPLAEMGAMLTAAVWGPLTVLRTGVVPTDWHLAEV